MSHLFIHTVIIIYQHRGDCLHPLDYHLRSSVSDSNNTSALLLFSATDSDIHSAPTSNNLRVLPFSLAQLKSSIQVDVMKSSASPLTSANFTIFLPHTVRAQSDEGAGADISWGGLSLALILCQGHRHMQLHPAGRSCTGCREHCLFIH